MVETLRDSVSQEFEEECANDRVELRQQMTVLENSNSDRSTELRCLPLPIPPPPLSFAMNYRKQIALKDVRITSIEEEAAAAKSDVEVCEVGCRSHVRVSMHAILTSSLACDSKASRSSRRMQRTLAICASRNCRLTCPLFAPLVVGMGLIDN